MCISLSVCVLVIKSTCDSSAFAAGHQAAMSARQGPAGVVTSPQSHTTVAAGHGAHAPHRSADIAGAAGATADLPAKRQAAVEVYDLSGDDAADNNDVQQNAAAASKRQRTADQVPASTPPAAAESSAKHVPVQPVAQPDAMQSTAAAVNPLDAIKQLTQQLLSPATAELAAKAMVAVIVRHAADSTVKAAAGQAIPGLLLLLSSSDVLSVREAAAAALYEIVTGHPNNTTAVTVAGGIQQLLSVLRCSSNTTCIKCWAAHVLLPVLQQHADSRPAAAAVQGCDIILCGLLQDNSTAVVAAQLIGMVVSHCSREAAQRLISALIVQLQKLTTIKEDRQEASALITALVATRIACDSRYANSSRNRVLLAEAGGIQALVAVLRESADRRASSSSSEEDPWPCIHEAAACALGCAIINAPACRSAVAAAGGIEPLVRLMFSSNERVIAAAATALHQTICDCDENKEAVLAVGTESIIRRLVQLLSSGHTDVFASAADVLLTLARGSSAAATTTRNALVQADVIAAVVHKLSVNLLTTDSDTAAAMARTAAHFLSSLRSINASWVDTTAKAIRGLLKLLLDCSSAANTTSSSGSRRQQYCSLAGAIASALVTMIRHHAAHQEQFIGCGGIPSAVQLLNTSKDAVVLYYAAGMLTVLALPESADNGSRYRSLIVEAGAISPLVVLLNAHSNNSSGGGSCTSDLPWLKVARQAAFVLCRLATYQYKVAIVRAGAIQPLVQLLRVRVQVAVEGSSSRCGSSHCMQDIQDSAAGALAGLAEGRCRHQTDIAAAGGIGDLVSLLAVCSNSSGGGGISQISTKVQAARALAAVATSQARGRLAVAAGAIPALVKLLLTDNASNQSGIDSLHEQVARALAAVAKCMPKYQVAIAAEAGAVDRLVRIVQSSRSEQVRRAAAAALRVLKENPAAASGIPGDLVLRW